MIVACQVLSYIMAAVIPYFMVIRSHPLFYYSCFAAPVIMILHCSGPLTTLGICIYATLIGLGGILFSGGHPEMMATYAVDTAWLWYVFYLANKTIEKKDTEIRAVETEIEDLELECSDCEILRRNLEESSNGARERVSRYTSLRSFTDDLAFCLKVKEVQTRTESFVRSFFPDRGEIKVSLEIFPAPDSPQNMSPMGEWMARHKVPLNVSDLSQDPRFSSLSIQAKNGSFISCPIERENLIMGSLTILSPLPRKWEDEDLRSLTDIASIISLALSSTVYYEKIEQMAVKDSLTGLYVRYLFDERIHEEFSRSRAGHIPLSLILFDIDHFKKVNDRWGHLVGDQVLREVSQTILKQTRETDFCARYGGEEFAVIMPFTNQKNSHMIAERIRSRIEATKVGKESIHVTVSGGIASASESVEKDKLQNLEGADDFIELADRALYQAKASGRNRIVLSTLG